MTDTSCIHCHMARRSHGVYCADCYAQALTTQRLATRAGKSPVPWCVNRGQPVRAVKVQRVIDRYGDDLCALDAPRGNDSRVSP